jgi:hypothetical protein
MIVTQRRAMSNQERTILTGKFKNSFLFVEVSENLANFALLGRGVALQLPGNLQKKGGSGLCVVNFMTFLGELPVYLDPLLEARALYPKIQDSTQKKKPNDEKSTPNAIPIEPVSELHFD